MKNQNIVDVFPMSDIQKGMVVLSMMYPDKRIYHDQFIYQIPKVEKRRFQKALELMTEKHAILRTAFDLYNYSQEVQLVMKRVEIKVWEEDLLDKENSEQEKYIQQFIKKERARPYDFAVAPLWRAAIFHVAPQRSVFILQFHHAILDGWSVASLNTELTQIYKALETQPDFQPSPLKASYRDAVVEEILEKKNAERAAFWQNELADYKRLAIFKREDAQAFYRKYYEPTFIQQLREKCQEDGLTLPTVLLGAYLYALHTLVYDSEVLIGMVTNNRPIVEDGDKILGCFLNTLPLRCRTEMFAEQNWIEYFKGIHEQSLNIKKNGRLTMMEIARVLGENTKEQNPFFDVLFNFIDFHVYNDIETGAENASVIESTATDLALDTFEATNTNLNLSVNTYGGALEFSYKLSKQLKSEFSLIQLHELVDKALQEYLENARQSIYARPLVNETAGNKLIVQYNDTEQNIPKDKTVLHYFREQVEQTPKHTALVFNQYKLNYQELDAISNQLANYLIGQKDVQPEDLIGIKLERSQWSVIGILGILKTGAAYLPMDTEYPAKRLEYLQEDSNYKICLDAELIDQFKREQQNFSIRPPDHLPMPEQLAYVIYTSGTTGHPKGVMIEHASLRDHILYISQYYPMGQQEKVLLFSNLTFDPSIEQIFVSLLGGFELHIAAKSLLHDPQAFTEYLDEAGITHLHATPGFLNILPLKKYPALRRVISGGERCTWTLANTWAKDYDFFNKYGPTETTVAATVYKHKYVEGEEQTIPIGRPVGNTQVYVVNQRGQLCPEGVEGELWISGTQVSRGYLFRPELSQEKFISNPFLPKSKHRIYKTGDLVRWRKDGQLEFIGRQDAQVKIRGYRIELGEIEHAILQQASITAAIVIIRKNKLGENELLAYYQATETIAENTLRDALKEHLPEYMLPSYYTQMDSFPLTVNGKTDIKSLPAPEGAARPSETNYEAPQNDMEEAIVEELYKVLKREQIGVLDNFFETGMDSLKTIHFMMGINQRFNSRLQIRDIYQADNVRLLAERIYFNTWMSRENNDILNCLIPDKPADTRIFAIPGGPGEGSVFHTLAREMTTASIFAFDFHGRTNNREVLNSIEEVAADFIVEMKKVQPQGPYVLCGYCLGGKIAYEMIVQLQNAGDEVANLILLDGKAPDIYDEELDEVIRSGRQLILYNLINGVIEFFGKKSLMEFPEFSKLTYKEQLDYVYELLDDVIRTKANREELKQYIDIRMNSYELSQKYRPDESKKIDADVIFFGLENRSEQDIAQRNVTYRSWDQHWHKFINATMEYKTFSGGTHDTFLYEPSAVETIAADITAVLKATVIS